MEKTISQLEQDKALYLNQIKELEKKVETEINLKKKILEDKENIQIDLNSKCQENDALKEHCIVSSETREALLKNENEKQDLQIEIIQLKQQIEENSKNFNLEIKKYTDTIETKQVIILLIIIISKE